MDYSTAQYSTYVDVDVDVDVDEAAREPFSFAIYFCFGSEGTRKRYVNASWTAKVM